MKFRNPKTEKVFDDIIEARDSFCDNGVHGCFSSGCCMSSEKNPEGISCYGFCIKYPAEAARLMGYEILEDDMEQKKDKPRICEVLGVEVSEQFRIGNGETIFWISPTGHFETRPSMSAGSSYAIMNAINGIEPIRKLPSLTPEELTHLQWMKSFGVKWVSRDVAGGTADKICFWRTEKPVLFQGDNYRSPDGYWTGYLPAESFPSIRPGDCICVEEAVST